MNYKKIIGSSGKHLSKCCDSHKNVFFLKSLTSFPLVGKMRKPIQEINDRYILTVFLIYSNLK